MRAAVMMMLAAAYAAAAPVTAVTTASSSFLPAAEPFPLSDVTLTEGSPFAVARNRNMEYVLSLEHSRLVCIFTSAANLTRCSGGRSCSSPGAATAPVCEPLPGEMGLGSYYGHYLGHWLSATALLINGTDDAAVRSKADGVLKTLNATMTAWRVKYGAEHDGCVMS